MTRKGSAPDAYRYADVGLGWQHWFSPQIEMRPEVTYYKSYNAPAFNGNFNATPVPIPPNKYYMWLFAGMYWAFLTGTGNGAVVCAAYDEWERQGWRDEKVCCKHRICSAGRGAGDGRRHAGQNSGAQRAGLRRL